MIKKTFLAFLIFMVIFLFSACSNEPFEGEVCELEYKEAYTTTVIIPITIFNGKTASVIRIPYVRSYPDRYFVKVRNFNKETNEYQYNECYVTKECFEQLKIGDWFVYDENYCYSSEPYTQEKA